MNEKKTRINGFHLCALFIFFPDPGQQSWECFDCFGRISGQGRWERAQRQEPTTIRIAAAVVCRSSTDRHNAVVNDNDDGSAANRIQ